MIYIIDDKESRQIDFDWNEGKFALFCNSIVLIRNDREFENKRKDIFQGGNVILFHESFPRSDVFKRELEVNSKNLYLAYFSGSKNARFISKDGRRCMLPVDVLYNNLGIFLAKANEGVLSFNYLAFGDNYEQENELREKIISVNKSNAGGEKILIEKKILFAVNSDDELEVEPPFDDLDIIDEWKNWELQKEEDISDIDLDNFVATLLTKEKYDSIYIPLCFGNVLSDYLGLRLALHIRLTKTRNQFVPIYIYGVTDIKELSYNYCFDILKSSSVKLIGCDNVSFIKSIKETIPNCDLKQDLKFINVPLPHNLGSHSMANQWGSDVLYRILFGKHLDDDELILARKSLYFKYILAQKDYFNFDNDNINDSQPSVPKTIEANDKRILFIDDEANKGWDKCLKEIFVNCPKDKFDIVPKKISDYKDLPEEIRNNIDKDEYDLYLLDLRLQGDTEEKQIMTSQFSGYRILKDILKKNKGNQVIILTASNKAWNLKNLISKGAIGYYIKESPELMLSDEFSIENYDSFKKDVEKAFSNKYKRVLYKKISLLQKNIKNSKKLKANGLNNEIIGIIWNSFIPFMIKIRSKEDFAAAYLLLYGIFERLKNNYINEINIYNNDSMVNVINEIYKQKGGGNDMWSDIEEVVDARNAFIHPKKHQPVPDFIYNQEGLIKLYDITSKILSSLLQ